MLNLGKCIVYIQKQCYIGFWANKGVCMKVMNYFSLLLLVAAQTVVAENTIKGFNTKTEQFKNTKSSTSKRWSKNKPIRSCSSSVRLICQSTIGTHGLIIDEPGQYCLAEDIQFSPFTDATHAITISASNVTLDLNGKRLIQVNDKKNNVGVFVSQNQRIVEIRNGFVENFGALGLWVSQGCREVSFEAMNVLNCGSRGHSPYSVQDGFQSNSRGFLAGGLGLGGFEAPGSRISVVRVKECLFLEVFSSEGPVFDPISGQNVDVIAVGIGGASVDGLIVEDSISSIISSSQATARGISLNDGRTVRISNHQATTIIHRKGGTGILLDGIASAEVSDSYVERVEDIGGVEIIQRGSIGIGALSTIDTSINNCFVTRAVNHSVTGVAHGIDVRSSKNVVVSNSKVFDCSGDSPLSSVAGIFYGAGAQEGTGISFVKCESTGNVSATGRAYGLDVEPLLTQLSPIDPIFDNGIPQEVVIDGCLAQNNLTAGFRFRNANSSTLLNSISKGNTHFGILLEETGGVLPTPGSFKNNVIEHNGTDSSDAGVQDNYTSNNSFVKNTAFANNAVNYVGIPVTTPLVDWIISESKPTGDLNQKFANLNTQP